MRFCVLYHALYCICMYIMYYITDDNMDYYMFMLMHFVVMFIIMYLIMEHNMDYYMLC